jgi:hypothetical protein
MNSVHRKLAYYAALICLAFSCEDAVAQDQDVDHRGGVSISCLEDQPPHLDTESGYVFALPTGFKSYGDPPDRFVSVREFDRSIGTFTGMEMSISLSDTAQEDTRDWPVLSWDHPLFSMAEVRFATYPAPGDVQSFSYVLVFEQKSVMIVSLSPVNVESAIGCLLPK